MATLDLLIVSSVGAKFAWVCGGLVAIGLALHLLSGVTPLTSVYARKMIAICAGALAISVLARLGFSAVELAGDVHGAADLLPVVWTVQRGAVIITLFGAGALAFGALAGSRLPLAMGVVAAAGAFGMTGHAQGLSTPFIPGLTVALHVLLAAFWVTAPLVLWPRKGMSDSELASRHKRFGAVALAGVPALFIAGSALALWFGGGVAGLFGSAYGLAIGAKLLLATTALCVGAWNRLSLVRLMTTDPVKAKRHLRRAMILDGVLFLGAAFSVALATTVAAPHG